MVTRWEQFKIDFPEIYGYLEMATLMHTLHALKTVVNSSELPSWHDNANKDTATEPAPASAATGERYEVRSANSSSATWNVWDTVRDELVIHTGHDYNLADANAQRMNNRNKENPTRYHPVQRANSQWYVRDAHAENFLYPGSNGYNFEDMAQNECDRLNRAATPQPATSTPGADSDSGAYTSDDEFVYRGDTWLGEFTSTGAAYQCATLLNVETAALRQQLAAANSELESVKAQLVTMNARRLALRDAMSNALERDLDMVERYAPEQVNLTTVIKSAVATLQRALDTD